MLICHRCNRRNCKALYWSDRSEANVCSACFVADLAEDKRRVGKEEYEHGMALHRKSMGQHSLLGIRSLVRTISSRLHKISGKE